MGAAAQGRAAAFRVTGVAAFASSGIPAACTSRRLGSAASSAGYALPVGYGQGQGVRQEQPCPREHAQHRPRRSLREHVQSSPVLVGNYCGHTSRKCVPAMLAADLCLRRVLSAPPLGGLLFSFVASSLSLSLSLLSFLRAPLRCYGAVFLPPCVVLLFAFVSLCCAFPRALCLFCSPAPFACLACMTCHNPENFRNLCLCPAALPSHTSVRRVGRQGMPRYMASHADRVATCTWVRVPGGVRGRTRECGSGRRAPGTCHSTVHLCDG